MKQKVKVTESQLRNMIVESVKKVLKERKEDSIFKSKEDATYWRDLYSPHAEDPDNGPYMTYRSYDGYDDDEIDDYNDSASDYNDRLRKRLATKGGQISYEFDSNPNVRDPFITKRQHDALEKYNKERDDIANYLKRSWLHGGMSDDIFKDLSTSEWLDKLTDMKVNPKTRK